MKQPHKEERALTIPTSISTFVRNSTLQASRGKSSVMVAIVNLVASLALLASSTLACGVNVINSGSGQVVGSGCVTAGTTGTVRYTDGARSVSIEVVASGSCGLSPAPGRVLPPRFSLQKSSNGGC